MKHKNKQQETTNYTELVMSKLSLKLDENSERLEKAKEAQRKLLVIRNEEGRFPALEECITAIKTLIKQIDEDRTILHKDYGVPSKIAAAAQRLDNHSKYEPYLPAVNDMNAAIKKYNAAFKKYKKQLVESGGNRSRQLHVLEQGFSKFANDHSIYFEDFFTNTDQLKGMIEKFLKEEQPTKNRDTSKLDEIVNSVK